MRTDMTKEQIKLARKELGLTARELGDQVGVSENTVNRWEMGVRSPSRAASNMIKSLLRDSRAQKLQQLADEKAAVPA